MPKENYKINEKNERYFFVSFYTSPDGRLITFGNIVMRVVDLFVPSQVAGFIQYELKIKSPLMIISYVEIRKEEYDAEFDATLARSFPDKKIERGGS